MLALIPYFTVPIVELGPLVIDSWATLVSLGFLAGLELARWRGIKLGLDVRDVVDGLVFTVAMGFVGGHFMHVLAYNFESFQANPLELLRIWGGFSSTGGFIGAVVGGLFFYRFIRRRDFWVHADTIMYGFPLGWTLGRLGCFTAHDHVGSLSTFPLAVDFTERFYVRRFGSIWADKADPALLGARHDLGLYEALCTLVILVVFLALRNRPVKSGFFLALWCILYAPARFGLDFLRNTDLPGADVRWTLGLTPAQWAMVVMFGAGLAIVAFRLRGGAEPEAPAAPEGDTEPTTEPLSDGVDEEDPEDAAEVETPTPSDPS